MTGKNPAVAGAGRVIRVRDRWATPQSLVDAVAAYMGGPPSLDLCCTPQNKKAPRGFHEGAGDLFSHDPAAVAAEIAEGWAWMNPPYSRGNMPAFTRWAAEYAAAGGHGCDINRGVFVRWVVSKKYCPARARASFPDHPRAFLAAGGRFCFGPAGPSRRNDNGAARSQRHPLRAVFSLGGTMTNQKFLSAPFPYFGGKRRAAALVWERLGEVKNYIEPFCGSAAVLLSNPRGGADVETINDLDGLLVNFWRAVRFDPEEVVSWLDYPVIETDLHARHLWLVQRREEISAGLQEDPHWHDAKAAGWWAWGASAWIGDGWCPQDPDLPAPRLPHLGNPQGVSRTLAAPIPHLGSRGMGAHKLVQQLPHLGNKGRGPHGGMSQKLPHLGNKGRGPHGGMSQQLPHLGDKGRGPHGGMSQKLPHLGDKGRGPHSGPPDGFMHTDRTEFLREWIRTLSHRLREVRVCNGHWVRVCNSYTTTTRFGLTGVFLDPPYDSEDQKQQYAVGGTASGLGEEVREWCKKWDKDPLMRIALCGHDGDHDELLSRGWTKEGWAGAGYARTESAKARAKSETIYFSPHCLSAAQGSLF